MKSPARARRTSKEGRNGVDVSVGVGVVVGVIVTVGVIVDSGVRIAVGVVIAVIVGDGFGEGVVVGVCVGEGVGVACEVVMTQSSFNHTQLFPSAIPLSEPSRVPVRHTLPDLNHPHEAISVQLSQVVKKWHCRCWPFSALTIRFLR